MPLWVTFPFDPAGSDLQPELLARVVRCEERRENGSPATFIAVHFDSSLCTSLGGNGSRKAGLSSETTWRRLAIPIRVRLRKFPWFEEAMTTDVSRDTLRFVTNREYSAGDALLVSFAMKDSCPWPGEGERPARVTQVERIPETSSLAVTLKKVSD